MSQLQTILEKHYKNYIDQSVENIKRDAKGLLHVISDYEGRVVFELLQNAFDKANEHIGIYIKDSMLYVANDGTRFTYNKNYDYENGDNEKRGDFLSICSMFTSTKSVATAIGNKGIGFKSVFSIAKNQHDDYRFQSRFVDVFTNGLFFDHNLNEGQVDKTAFRIYEMIREVKDIESLDEKTKCSLQKKIDSARNEYDDVGIPGYYFPFEIDPDSNLFVNILLEKYVTVIAIPLEKPEEIKKLIKENIITAGTQFNFVQLKYAKPFKVSIQIEDEKEYNLQTELNTTKLVAAVLNNDHINELAAKANINIEEVSIALYFRDDEQGKFYNYLPSNESSPFPYVDFHADFRTTLNRTQINWEGDVGEYNKALLRACLELLFQYFSDNRVELNCQYINSIQTQSKYPWHFNLLRPKFDIESENAKKIKSIFRIDDWNYKNLALYIGINTKSYFENQNKTTQIFLDFYKVIIAFSKVVTNDYNQKKYSKVEYFFNQLKDSFNYLEVQYLPEVISGVNQEVFFEKEKREISTLINLNFTNVEIDNSYEGKILKNSLKIKDASDINEYLRYYRQVNLDGNYHNESITEEQQIELLQNVYSFFIRKQDKDSVFCERYSSVLDADGREKYSLKNHANFSVSTLFLKLKNQKYKPAQLCNIQELDDDFKSKLDFPDEFFTFIGVSTIPYLKVFDRRLYDKLKDGLDFIPKLVSKNNEMDRIDKNVVLNCTIELRDKRVHPALINDNYVDIFSVIKSTRQKEIKPVFDILNVKNYDLFSTEYFSVLFNHVETFLRVPSYYNSLRVFYAYTFELFSKNKKWLVFNGDALEFTSSDNFFILKSKSDIENAIKQNLKHFLFYEADRGLSDEKLKSKVLEFQEEFIYNDDDKVDFTAELYNELICKLAYILYEVTNDHQSDRNYLDNDYNVLDIITNTKFYKVESLRIIKKSDRFQYDYVAEYFIKGQSVYTVDKGNKHKAKILSTLLFSTSRFAEKIEIILFHRNIEDLLIEYNQSEINIFKQKFDNTYQQKREQFLNKIKNSFPEIDIEEPKWNYETSRSMVNIKNNSKLDTFRNFLNELRYSDDFKDFDFGIDIISNVSEYNSSESREIAQHKRNNEIDFLVEKISTSGIKKSIKYQSTPDGMVTTSNTQFKKRIIKNYNKDSSLSVELESIGSNGEHEVLNYFISKFYTLDTLEKENVINDVFKLIESVVDDVKYYENLKNNLLDNLDSEDTLSLLIPYFYITNKYKYSYFDLVGFDEGRAQFVEVKTTSTNRNDFYISQAEIECALKYPNYQIARVSKDEIVFLGNPIVLFKDQLKGFQNNQYKLISTKYKIEFLP